MNYAVLYDFAVARVSFESYIKAIGQLDGKVQYVKFYGYNAKRDGEYKSYIKQTNADIAFTLGGRKTSRIDVRQIIDAVEIACSRASIDGFFLVCGHVDGNFLISRLQGLGKKVVLGQLSDSTLGSMCDGTINFDRTAGLGESRSQDVAVHEDKEFLPFTDIETTQDMSVVKANLEQLINSKLMGKKQTLPKKTELEELLKKYF
ncbi:MAG: NYN domain-containing protein [Christensenellales bacterium]